MKQNLQKLDEMMLRKCTGTLTMAKHEYDCDGMRGCWDTRYGVRVTGCTGVSVDIAQMNRHNDTRQAYVGSGPGSVGMRGCGDTPCEVAVIARHHVMRSCAQMWKIPLPESEAEQTEKEKK